MTFGVMTLIEYPFETFLLSFVFLLAGVEM